MKLGDPQPPVLDYRHPPKRQDRYGYNKRENRLEMWRKYRWWLLSVLFAIMVGVMMKMVGEEMIKPELAPPSEPRHSIKGFFNDHDVP